MRMLTRRVHLLLGEDQYERIASQARSRSVSVATVIREAIDRGVNGSDQAQRDRALRSILEAEPMSVPETVKELKAEIAGMHDRPEW
jgi:hypothetical protein